MRTIQRRIIPLFLLLCLLLTACGQTETGTETNEDTSARTDTWQTEALSYDGLAFQLSIPEVEAETQPGTFTCADGQLYDVYTTGGVTVARRLSMDLEVLAEVTLGDLEENESYGTVVWGTDAVYAEVIRTVASEDESDAGTWITEADAADADTTDSGTEEEILLYSAIRCYDLNGTLQWEAELDDLLESHETIGDLALCGDELLVVSDSTLLLLSADGTVAQQQSLNSAWYALETDDNGSVYLWNRSAQTVHLLDAEALTEGEALLTLDTGVTLLHGSGGYDFLLLDDTGLQGVLLEEEITVTLLTWADCDLSGVESAASADGSAWLLACRDSVLKTDELYLLTTVDETAVAEKATVILAVPVDSDDADPMEALGSKLEAMISRFDRTDPDYQIEVVGYTGKTALQMLLLTDDCPDLILFSSSYDTDEQSFAAAGYLEDLSTYLAEDDTLSEDDFVPAVLTALESYVGGGLYVLAPSVSLRTLAVESAVGGETGWSIADYCEAVSQYAQSHEIALGSADSLLSSLLSYSTLPYVDEEAGTCDFTGEDFLALLEFCKAVGSDQDSEDAETVQTTVTSIGGVSGLASSLAALSDTMTVTGYPGAEGNGGLFAVSQTFGICIGGSQKDGAWAFLKTLFGESYQSGGVTLELPVIASVLEDKLAELVSSDETVTQADAEEMQALIEGVESCVLYHSELVDIILEEAASYFSGSQSAASVADVIQNRVQIYLDERS